MKKGLFLLPLPLSLTIFSTTQCMLKMKNLVTLPKNSLLKLANKGLPQVKLSKGNLATMLGARPLHSGSYKGATIANMLGARSLHSASYKGTTTLFKPEYSPLSPLTGIGLQETGWLQKNWELIPDSATAQLIASPENGLFYKLQSQFRPTQNKSLPGYSLTPKLLGQLIGYMETGAIFDLIKAGIWAAPAYLSCAQATELNKDLNLPLALLELKKDNYLLATLKKGLFGESTNVRILQDTNLIKIDSTACGALALIGLFSAGASLSNLFKAIMPLDERSEKLEKLAIIRHYLENILLKIRIEKQ